MKKRKSMLVDEETANAAADRFDQPTEQERQEQAAILRAFHHDKEALAPGTVVGYMGKFSAFWKFREWSRHERGGDRDLFLLLTPQTERRQVWLDYIAFLSEVLRVRGQSCFEHLSATKRVLSRNGVTDLSFADDSALEVRDAKLKAKYTIEELQDREGKREKSKKYPMFEELEDLLYKRLWVDSEADVPYDQVYKRGNWIGIALMTLSGLRPSNLVVTALADHTIRAKSVRLMLMRGDDSASECYYQGGDAWPPDYTAADVCGCEALFHCSKTGQQLGRRVFPSVDVRTIRLNTALAWWFRFSGVRPDDMLLTMYRQSPKKKAPAGVDVYHVRDCDISGYISSSAYMLGFESGHFSSRSCRIGLVTGAGWRSGVDWENNDARDTARMGGWADARAAGAMRRHYDLSRIVYREIHPDLALKQVDVWEMLPFSQRQLSPRPEPARVGQCVRGPPAKDQAPKRRRKK